VEQLLDRSRALAAELRSGAQHETSACDGGGLVRVVLDGSGLVSDVQIATRRGSVVAAAELADAVVDAVTTAQLARLQQVMGAAPVAPAPQPAQSADTVPPAPVQSALDEVLALLADLGRHVDAALAGAATDVGRGQPTHEVRRSPACTVTVTAERGAIVSVAIDDRWFATAADASLAREITLGCRAAQTASLARSRAAVAAPLAALQRAADRLLQVAPDPLVALRRDAAGDRPPLRTSSSS
jgi:DNA-binding protein YbaB